MDPWMYIVILGAAVIGYALMKPHREIADRGAVVGDIESALDQFASELEDENQQLLQSIAGMKRELEAEINKLNGRVEALEKHAATVPAVAPASAERVPVAAPAADEVQGKPARADSQASINNRYTHIIELHNKGKSVEFIAKKNGMNKGEVQLIIQLAQQEEKFRV